MPQNIYDNEEFFAGYSKLGRQIRGLDGAAEWPTMQTMLPSLAGRRVLDLGCGFGWFSRWAIEHGAVSVRGLDLSQRMLERARSDTDSLAITYDQTDLDEVELPADSFDLVFSSLTLHYITDLPRLMREIAGALTSGGRLVFSVEHPIYSASANQNFEAIEQYLVEGPRSTNWFADGVIKEHRTIATYVNDVIGAGMTLDQIDEWGGEPGDELDRPWFLLVSATKS